MTETHSRSISFVLASATASKDNAAIQGMQAQLSPYQVRDNIPMFALHGVISRPLPGACMVVLYQGGNPSKAACVGVNDPRYYLSGLPDGTVGLAHHLGASVLFYADHIQIEANGKPVTLANAGQVTITTSSKVRIEGDLEVTGQVTAQADAAAVHLSTHTHTGVTPGSGNTGGPVG
jgi:phage gp45-like